MGARVEERGMPLRPCGWTDDDDVTPEGHFVNPRMLTRFCWMMVELVLMVVVVFISVEFFSFNFANNIQFR